MRLYLVRHGQTEWNASGRAQGHSDVELDQTGHWQAKCIAKALANVNVGTIYASDLKRCVMTAQPLAEATGLEIKTREDLRERTFGRLEGSHYTEIRAWFAAECRAQGLQEHELRPEDGESLRDVWCRLVKFQAELERIRTNAVVFTHGGTCSLIVSRLIQSDAKTARSFRFENASITEFIRRSDGLWQLLRFADSKHLQCHDPQIR